MLYRAVEINEEGNSTEPVQYVGTYVLRWGSVPSIGFTEVDVPSLEPLRQFLKLFGSYGGLTNTGMMDHECPACHELLTSAYHTNECWLNGMFERAKECLGELEKLHE